MSRYNNSSQSSWAVKVFAIIRSGNSQAALAQIKVAPTVKDLYKLRELMRAQKTPPDRMLEDAIDSNVALLLAPRLHRAP